MASRHQQISLSEEVSQTNIWYRNMKLVVLSIQTYNSTELQILEWRKNRPISQITGCTCSNSLNARLWNRNVRISVPKWYLVRLGTSTLRDLWIRSRLSMQSDAHVHQQTMPSLVQNCFQATSLYLKQYSYIITYTLWEQFLMKF